MPTASRRSSRSPRTRSARPASASRSPRPTAWSCCPTRPTASSTPSSSPTSGCTRTSTTAPPAPATRRATCSCPRCRPSSPRCTSTPARSPSSPPPSPVASPLPASSSTQSRAAPSPPAAATRRFAMTSEQLDEVARAAELHDVGKVGIPDAILDKPGRLDEDEWEFMRQHTILGERILNAAAALRPVAQLVRSSHERWDGTGYPDKLRGADTPLGSRIIAVCDAYEAMTSDRAYRSALAPEVAAEELRASAGTQFDPEVVDAFLDAIATRDTPAAPDREPIDAPIQLAAHRVRTLLTQATEAT